MDLNVCLILGFMVCQLISGENFNSSSIMLSAGKRRKAKIGVFSIVNFPNEECTASDGDKGTCMTAPECSERGGTVSGTCATGFGSCCTIYNKECGGVIRHNVTYITNPGYPTWYTTAQACLWTVPKVSSNVCFIRVDMDEMTIANPDTKGRCTTDFFRGTNANTGTNWPRNPPTDPGNRLMKICGILSGHHFYMDAGPYTSDSARLRQTLNGGTGRIWKIKVSQIECENTNRPPQGCFQYHTGVVGTVRSLNFDQASSSDYLHLANHQYKTCIRRESGYCKIAWTQSDDTDSFKISGAVISYTSDTGSDCSDSVKIYHGSNNGESGCSTPTGPTSYVDRYCGGTLNCNAGSISSAIIISDRIPFELEVDFNKGENKNYLNRGFCLNYRQILCN